MTAQISERLVYRGETHAMCAEPLAQYFRLAGENPGFQPSSTMLWRGYIGTWEIRDDRLYLIGLDAKLRDGSPASLETVFPGFPERVFAHWFNGQLRLPRGELLKYVHMGWGSQYEEDLFLEVSRGIVTGSWTRRNGVALPSKDEGP
jgi:hypothetical protein